MPSSTSNSSIVSSYIVPCCCFFASVVATLSIVWSLDRLSAWSYLDVDPAIYTKWRLPKSENFPLFYKHPHIETGKYYKRRASYITERGNIRKLYNEAIGYHQHPYNSLPDVEVKYGKYGFRDNAFSPNSDVAIFGSSYVEAGFATQEESWVGWLEKDYKLSAANFGVAGVGAYTFLHYLERYILPMKPKHVVWIFAERADWENVVKEEDIIRNYREKLPLLPNIGNYLFGTALFMLVEPIERLMHVYAQNTGVKHIATNYVPQFSQIEIGGKSYNIDFINPPSDATFERSKLLLPSVLEKMNNLCSRNNASFSILYIPSRRRLLAKVLGLPLAEQDELNTYFNTLQAISNQKQIPIIDITQKLHTALEKGVMVINPINDQHLNEVGMRIASRELAKLVANSSN